MYQPISAEGDEFKSLIIALRI